MIPVFSAGYSDRYNCIVLYTFDRKGEHRLYKVRQYCVFATANLLTPLELVEGCGGHCTETQEDTFLSPVVCPPHAYCQIADAVSLILDQIHPPLHMEGLSPRAAAAGANKTAEQLQEEQTNLVTQEKDVGIDLRLEAAWALRRVLRYGGAINRWVTYQVLWTRAGVPRILERLHQQADGPNGATRHSLTRSCRAKADGQARINCQNELASDMNDDKCALEEDKAAVVGDILYSLPQHDGLVLALLECLDTLASAPLPTSNVSCSTLTRKILAGPITAAENVTTTSQNNLKESQFQINIDTCNSDKSRARKSAPAAVQSETLTAEIKEEMRLEWARARLLDELSAHQGPPTNYKHAGHDLFDGIWAAAFDGESAQAIVGMKIDGTFIRMVTSIIASLKGKFYSLSVKRMLHLLEGRVDHIKACLGKKGEGDKSEKGRGV